MKTVIATTLLVLIFTNAQAQSLITCSEELSGDRGTKMVTVAYNTEGELMMNEMRETTEGTIVNRAYPVMLETSDDKIRVKALDFRTVQSRRRLTIDKATSVGTLRKGNTIVLDSLLCAY
jgi:hypothetical protein